MTRRSRPVILAVDSDPTAIGHISVELQRRYDRDYNVVFEVSADAALRKLEAMAKGGEQVALVLAGHPLPRTGGEEILAEVQRLHPHAKRALLVAWGERGNQATAEVIRASMASGQIDYYVLKPWKSPDELFHRTISAFLHEWARADPSRPYEVTVVADAFSVRGHELRNLLTRNGVPHVFFNFDSPRGCELRGAHLPEGVNAPLVILLGGRVLVDPSNAELATGYGAQTEIGASKDFDVVVVGGGPAGLSAAVYASSEGLRALVVEREAIGGQAGSSSMIRNYLGFPRGVAGADLAQQAYQQAWIFGASFLLMREVISIVPLDGRYKLTISDGTTVAAGSVVLAMGVSYRTLDIPSFERLKGAGVYYGASASEAPLVADGRVFVVGAGNSAGQAAVYLAKFAKQVSILVRGDGLAEFMSKYLIDEIDLAPNIDVRTQVQIVDGAGDERLKELSIKNASGDMRAEPADAVFVLIGAVPRTEWLPQGMEVDRFGFLRTGADLVDQSSERTPLMYETSLPGVFAVGDVRSGSVKRVASGVGEGSVVISQVHKFLASAPVSP